MGTRGTTNANTSVAVDSPNNNLPVDLFFDFYYSNFVMPSSTPKSEPKSPVQYPYVPKMDNILPPSIAKLDRPLPQKPTLERNMTDSFLLEHSGLLSPTPAETPATSASSEEFFPPVPSPTDEPVTPIANWAHLALIKKERVSLKSQLKAQRVANDEAKASVSALRRLTFRMAINISVKERQIAKTARALAHSRKKEYISSRSADKRIEALTKSWKEEERRNADIVESLERISRLTLQCMKN